MQFAKQEIVKYKAKDGLDLEGVLSRPLNEESSTTSSTASII